MSFISAASTATIPVNVGINNNNNGLVRRAVGLWMAQKVVVAAAGIFSSQKKKIAPPLKPPSTPFSLWGSTKKKYLERSVTNNQKGGSAKKEEATIVRPTSTSSWKKTIAIAAASTVGAVYVLYPTSLLLLFRVSEQISWVRLFQNYHSCRMGSYVNCIPVGMVQLFQLAATLGSMAFFGALWKGKKIAGITSLGKGLVYYGLFWMLAIAIMKVSVDHITLYQPTTVEDSTLVGKVAVITGANRGIGLATAHWLAAQGVHVVVTCRTISKCQPVVDEINNRHHATGGIPTASAASASVLDLSSLQSANDLVSTISNNFPNGIHYLFCNAGTTPQYDLTKEGFEDGFGGMHLAHMAVTLGLLPLLKKGSETHLSHDDSRIVMVSSEMSINAAMGVFGPLDTMFDRDNLRGEITRGDGTLATSMPAYGRAKLCNVLLALELNRQMKDPTMDWPIIAHAVHTGAVVTDSSRNSIKRTFEGVFPGLSWIVGYIYFPLLWRNVQGGARTLLCAALSKEDHVARGGQYLDALCRAFLPETITDKDLSPQNIIPIPLGGGKTLDITLDAVQALLLADANYSSFLWDVSLEHLRESPAKSVVDFHNNAVQGYTYNHKKQSESLTS